MQYISILIGLICGIYILVDAGNRKISRALSLLGFLLNLVGLGIYLIIRNKAKAKSSESVVDLKVNTPSVANETITIPEYCPHCKNPNSKKIRLCEWCGNQII